MYRVGVKSFTAVDNWATEKLQNFFFFHLKSCITSTNKANIKKGGGADFRFLYWGEKKKRKEAGSSLTTSEENANLPVH